MTLSYFCKSKSCLRPRLRYFLCYENISNGKTNSGCYFDNIVWDSLRNYYYYHHSHAKNKHKSRYYVETRRYWQCTQPVLTHNIQSQEYTNNHFYKPPPPHRWYPQRAIHTCNSKSRAQPVCLVCRGLAFEHSHSNHYKSNVQCQAATCEKPKNAAQCRFPWLYM